MNDYWKRLRPVMIENLKSSQYQVVQSCSITSGSQYPSTRRNWNLGTKVHVQDETAVSVVLGSWPSLFWVAWGFWISELSQIWVKAKTEGHIGSKKHGLKFWRKGQRQNNWQLSPGVVVHSKRLRQEDLKLEQTLGKLVTDQVSVLKFLKNS